MAEIAARSFFQTGIGKKYLMGITGLIWAGFVLVHMAGNLLILVSAKSYNLYAHALEKTPITPVVEALLIVTFAVHIYSAATLTRMNRKARGEGRYAKAPNGEKSTYKAARIMGIQGSIILVFLISHLATFKYGTYYETTIDGVAMRDLHRLVVDIFKQPGFVAWYVVALLVLGFHLSHGVGSSFQSFGILNDRIASNLKKLSYAYAGLVALGFLAQPIYVYFLN